MRLRAPSRQTVSILDALLAAPLAWRHGYALAREVRLGPGTLYPILVRLHERGLLEAQWREPERPGVPARHAYRLSAEGLAFARALRDTREAPMRPVPEVPA